MPSAVFLYLNQRAINTMNLSMRFAACSGFVAVALGAFGAHSLKQSLSANMLAVYQTAVDYQFIHTLALLVLSLLLAKFPGNRLIIWSAVFFALGIVLFSGSLYLLAISGLTWLGAITPVGGLAFLVAWFMLFLATFQLSKLP